MSRIQDILEFNQQFIAQEAYKKFETTKYPSKKIAILSCMDTRLTELLPAALGIKNGDAKLIKNAGAVISHPYGSVMRSLMVCIYELGVDTILVVGHYDCGMKNLSSERIIQKMQAHGIDEKVIKNTEKEIDLDQWLSGFDDVEESVIKTVNQIKEHPFIPADLEIHGLVMDPSTGEVKCLNTGEA